MKSVCTNSEGIAPGVGMNLISSLGAMPVVGGGGVRVVGNEDVVEDVGGQVSLRTMDGDRDVSPWVNKWDGPVSSCVMEPMS